MGGHAGITMFYFEIVGTRKAASLRGISTIRNQVRKGGERSIGAAGSRFTDISTRLPKPNKQREGTQATSSLLRVN